MRDTRLAVPSIFLLVWTLLTGVAFAHWSEPLLLTGSVATGLLDWRFTDVGHWDPGPPPDSVRDYHCRDNFEGRPWQGEKDVGYTTAVITADPHVIAVALNNVYPSYFNSISVYAKNTGTIPLIFEKAIIEGTVVMGTRKVRLDLNEDGKYDLEIWWRTRTFGIQLEPGDDPEQVANFWVHVLQGAPRDASLNFTIKLVAVQWNYS